MDRNWAGWARIPPGRHALWAAPTLLGAVLAVSFGSVVASDEVEDRPANDAAAAVATGALSGVVRYAKDEPLRDVVVYLEPSDPSVTFASPEQPAILRQKDTQFFPSLLPIARGQSVEFHNDEGEPIEHNVFSRSPAQSFDIGLNAPGVVQTVTFDQTGEVMTYCSIHRLMEGVIYVCPTPFHAAVGIVASEETAGVRTGGEFAIEGVPPGEYVLRTWQKRKRTPEAAIPVTIRAGETTKIDVELTR